MMMIVTRFAGCVYLWIAINVSFSNGDKLSVFPNPKTEVSEEAAFEKLLNLESKMQSGIESLIKSAIPMVVRQGSEVDLSEGCMASLLKTLLALKDMKLWAVQMLDATGKPGSGILLGSPGILGSYHQCLNIKIPDGYRDKKSNGPPETGQYCIISLRTPLPPKSKKLRWFKPLFNQVNATFKTEAMKELLKMMWALYESPIKLGVCVPSACSEDDMRQLLEAGASRFGIDAELDECQLPDESEMDTVQKSIFSIIVSIIVFCAVVTLALEVRKYCFKGKKVENDSNAMKILKSFSMVENTLKLMKTRPAQKRSLDAMNGMRFLSATWVLLGHSYIILNRNQLSQLLNIKEILNDFFLTCVTGAIISVDSFLFITGTLVAYNLVAFYDSKKTFNPIIVILRRIWRFMPTVLLITGVGFLFPILGSGPEYKSMAEDMADLCQRRWWYNLLFISNYLPINGTCVGHLWYLSADIQLFLYAMIYCVLLFRKPKYGQIFLCLGIFAGVFSSGLVTYLYQFPPTLLADAADVTKMLDYANYMYTKPNVHLGNYSIGLFLGTYLARHKDTNVTRFRALIGWTIAIAFGMTAVYGVYPWFISGNYTMLEAVAFSASQRTIWGIALAWLTYACFVGKGGYVNDFLSWPGFQPLGKLSFQFYVIHYLIQLLYWYTRLGNLELTHSTIVFSFFGNLCISHILSLAMRLFVEAPGIELERVFFSWLFGGSKKRDENGKTEHQLEEKYIPKDIKDITNDKMAEENAGFRL